MVDRMIDIKQTQTMLELELKLVCSIIYSSISVNLIFCVLAKTIDLKEMIHKN